ncbi:MAG: hypothetical protein L0Y54_11515 [Sporichthyaceae bacterium]|nr:hypothetical protein [Sporichthyaceae bacterium]
MAAVQLTGTVLYDALLVTASVVIAAVAATVALWFTVRVRGGWATTAAALIMGVAVNGMHFTGMASVSVRLDRPDRVLDGASALEFLLPLIIGIGVVSGLLLGIISMSPNEDELRIDAEWRERINARLRAQAAVARARQASAPSMPNQPGGHTGPARTVSRRMRTRARHSEDRHRHRAHATSHALGLAAPFANPGLGCVSQVVGGADRRPGDDRLRSRESP